MLTIHETAVISATVTLGDRAIVEAFALIGIQDRFHPPGAVVIGDDSFIGSRCTIYNGVIAGSHFDISDQSTVFTDNQIGDYVRIGPKAIIKNGCRIGNRVRINAAVFIERVIIEDNVFIGPHTVFTDDLHPPCPRYSECVPKTHVESNVSIGANVTIAPGITIGHHSQIYAGSVVIANVAPNSVMAGNPARIVKRFDELECRAGFFKKPFEWWESGT
jgi:acetyltransferase-like isoleucine patch superfamily enzyme